MVPNIIYAIKSRDSFESIINNKFAETTEQIGRFGCICFMIINIPGTCYSWQTKEAFFLYIIINAILVTLYCVVWGICFNKNSLLKSILLSVIPSAVFLFSGIMLGSVLLTIFSVIFAVSHIIISCKNAALRPDK